MTPTGSCNPRIRLAILLAACAAMGACEIREENEAASDNVDAATMNLPTMPLPEPPMGRAALLSAVARAASAQASGTQPPQDLRQLEGRRFELRIRFGCRGPAGDLQDAALGWSYNPESRTLRVRATPSISTETEIVAQVAGEAVEEVEGFWIPRPWLLEPVCPAAAAVRSASAQAEEPGAGKTTEAVPPTEDVQETEAPPPAYPKVGIAHFFTEADPRTRRRQMRPYEVVKTLVADQPISPGFNLVLSGRLRALPGKGVFHCVSRGADAPPDCIVSADFDRVWIERADTREVLAQWGTG